MLHFDLNISILLQEVPFLERFARATVLGFEAVEFWWPGNEQLAAVAWQLQGTGLKVALMNMDAGAMTAGERGYCNDARQQERFRQQADLAIDFAAQIGCPQLNVLVGNSLADRSHAEQLATVRENLAWVAERAARAGRGVVVESLNAFENPRYLLTNTRDTLALFAEVRHPNLKYQYDIYHMQRMEGNLIATLREHIGQIGHIQLADSPARHEPGTGEIHYPHVLAALDELTYQGYVGLEYNPTTTSEASFAWLPPGRRDSIAVSDLRL
jgi:hydroxypyruvate isomerase